MNGPESGRTCLAHVQELLTDAALAIDEARCAIHPLRKLSKVEREALSRRLAGVVSAGEMVRIWLGAGAPR